GRLLEEAGWTEERVGETGPVIWSEWTCPNETGEVVGGFFLGFAQGELYSLQVDREISPGSRKQAEIESRERARAMERAAARDRSARVELEAPVTGDTI